MTAFFDYLAINLAKALSAVLQQNSYLYWPYLLSSLVIALFAWRWLGAGGVRRSWREFWSQYFDAALWWHRSARADYVLYLANALLLPAFFTLVLVEHRDFVLFIQGVTGLPAGSDTNVGVMGRLVYTVLFFVAYDFGRFAAHCLLHDVPLLWEFHKVHHSAEVLTPMTSFRAHPVELLLMSWGPLVMTGIATAAFNVIAPGRVSVYTFLGLHVFFFAFNLVDNLRHSPVWLSYGTTLGRWLVSPAHHQLHHSCEPRHLGCNRGFNLAIWDRLYGTLYAPGMQPEHFRLGLDEASDGREHRLVHMYLAPFAAAGRGVSAWVRRSRARLSVR